MPVLGNVDQYAAYVVRGEQLKFLCVYADAEGESHFQGVEVACPVAEFVPGKPVIGLSPAYRAIEVAFAQVPSDWEGGWHPTPRRQFGVIVSGVLDIRASDGEVHRFTPGSVFLLEDTTGKGHNTSIMGETEAILLFAWLDPLR